MSKEEILELNKSLICIYSTVEELQEIYLLFEKPSAKGALIGNKSYVTFKGIENIQFIVETGKSFDRLSFIGQFDTANLNEKKQGFIEFFFLEFWQGNSYLSKLFHLFYSLFIIFIFNLIVVYFSSEKSINNYFMGILTAVSIFIAIFSVFTTNHDQLNRKKPSLFRTGKISYYFSVDRNLTIAGLFAIFASLMGLLIVHDDSIAFIHNLILNNDYLLKILSRKGFIMFLMNVSFVLTFITLRSLVEFYIHRPAMYFIGEMKDTFLNEF